jgi:hypothetical protein
MDEVENVFEVAVTVRSLDPSVSTVNLAGNIQGARAALLLAIKHQGAESVEISRDLTFPVPGGDVALEILIGLATGAAEEIGKEIAKSVLRWLRESWPDAQVELIQLKLSEHLNDKD